MNFICPKCNTEGSVADNLIPEYGCWHKCVNCKEGILLNKNCSVVSGDSHEHGCNKCSDYEQCLAGIKHIGRLKFKGNSCVFIDEKSTRYEIFNYDIKRLKSSWYSPDFQHVRIKMKDTPAETDRNHYFVFDQDLYFSEYVIDNKVHEIISNKFSNWHLVNVPQEPHVDLIPPSEQNFSTNQNIENMSGIEFEKLIKRLLEKMDFEVQETKQTGDGGVDLIAYSSDQISGGRYIIQCKRWNNIVGETYIRDLYGVVTAHRANKGILITNSTFSKSAVKFAENLPIGLIDGEMLNNLLDTHELAQTNKFKKFSEYAKALS